jgi:hypothetical protein
MSGDGDTSEPSDPFGKRALFWYPTGEDSGDPMQGGEARVPGRHALFSAASAPSARKRGQRARAAKKKQPPVKVVAATKAERAERRQALATRAARGADAGATSKRKTSVLKAVQVASPEVSAADEGTRPAQGMLGPVVLRCSSCGARSEVDVVEYLVLHLPVWLWRPGRGFTRFMTCPACRRRTWVSAAWSPWGGS